VRWKRQFDLKPSRVIVLKWCSEPRCDYVISCLRSQFTPRKLRRWAASTTQPYFAGEYQKRFSLLRFICQTDVTKTSRMLKRLVAIKADTTFSSTILFIHRSFASYNLLVSEILSHRRPPGTIVPEGLMFYYRCFFKLINLFPSPRDLWAPSADRRETLPHDLSSVSGCAL